jgi:hypothetical protein
MIDAHVLFGSLSQIGVAWRDLTIEVLWKADLRRHSKNVRFVLEQAQGESALEEFLADIAHKWEVTKFDLVDYRQKCFLIRNWDPLFELVCPPSPSPSSSLTIKLFAHFLFCDWINSWAVIWAICSR